MQELFDSSLPYDWMPVERSGGYTTYSAMFDVPLEQDVVVGDLPLNVLEDLLEDGFDLEHELWARKRQDPYQVPITSMMIEVEIVTLHRSLPVITKNSSSKRTPRMVYELSFSAHLITQKKFNPLATAGDDPTAPSVLGQTFAATGLGNAAIIFSTIKKILEDFAEQKKDRLMGLVFAGKGASRQRLYRTFALALTRSLNFELVDMDEIAATDFKAGSWIHSTLGIIEDLIASDDRESSREGAPSEWFVLLSPAVLEDET